jgi:hypothetical protein
MTAGLWIKEKKSPHESWGAEGHHHEHSLQKLPLPTGAHDHASRCDSTSALSYREHLSWIFVLTVSLRLLALFTPNSGEGLPKVRINASRVTKRMIEDRFHLGSLSRVCVIRTFLSLMAARCVPCSMKSRWFRGLGRWPFFLRM